MLAQMLPRDTLYWIFLKQTAKQICKKRACIRNWLERSGLYFCYQLLQTTCFEWRQAGCHFVHHTSQGPNIRLKAIDTIIVEKLWRHVVRCAILSLWAILSLLPLSCIVVLAVFAGQVS